MYYQAYAGNSQHICKNDIYCADNAYYNALVDGVDRKESNKRNKRHYLYNAGTLKIYLQGYSPRSGFYKQYAIFEVCRECICQAAD